MVGKATNRGIILDSIFRNDILEAKIEQNIQQSNDLDEKLKVIASSECRLTECADQMMYQKTQEKFAQALSEMKELEAMKTELDMYDRTVVGNSVYFCMNNNDGKPIKMLEVSMVSTKENYSRYYAIKMIVTHLEYGHIADTFLPLRELLYDGERNDCPSALMYDGTYYEWDNEFTEEDKLKLNQLVSSYIKLWR